MSDKIDELELYKKYRPTAFKQIVGQAEAVNTLTSWFKNNKVPHTMLFTGPSGCGKTTLARIVQKKLNCGRADFKEINGASSRGIDDVREIERRMGSSSVQGSCRIWYIDECHKLTNDAQNALLKITEDTPRHVYFLLATTIPGKLIETIKTRASTINLKLLSPKEMDVLIRRTAAAENVELSDEVIDKIVNMAEGMARKGMVLLGQIINLPTEQEQLDALIPEATQRKGFELWQMLINPSIKWREVGAMLKELEEEPEGIRRMVLAIATKVLCGGGAKAGRAFIIINTFRDHYYDCGKAGLVANCYEVVSGPG